MALALGHPRLGYYVTRDPLGAAGDFTTAPEISQMFGELIGLWAAETWSLLGRPAPLRLVELGPGRGTLMSDALRAAGVLPGFREALTVHLVETSPALREAQARTLQPAGVAVTWHLQLAEVPPGPAIVIANEFFDALPIRQFVRARTGWHERMVGLGPDGALSFGLAPDPDPRLAAPGQPGDVLEVGEAGLAIAAEIGARLARGGGAALVIDYGHHRSGPGETLQSVRHHAFADPLAEPGEADLTAHVDFEALARAAARAGASVHGPESQGDFLRALGIEARAERLRRGASAEQAAEIGAALRRLTGPGPDGMGDLFKAVAFAQPGVTQLPGFAPPAASVRAAQELEQT
ncbi:class I SAM-dependent methyltransferase [Enterovirga sp. DB1703]|uniref:Class I SAM-dependent methyltransferase n=2 Tax=Enterovirga aerilata TaxID=2730920 RepID=A0A849I164_9HYPH|nr:SAM-dependent methyltransferase [Enterovirga sp. DB1703]NNM73516.1 class I SAM-dependent methyltransferase [Enterovirga sp. DB1703]